VVGNDTEGRLHPTGKRPHHGDQLEEEEEEEELKGELAQSALKPIGRQQSCCGVGV